MEIEHIDENSIRVLICMEDLDKRGIDLIEMMESPVKTESFFHSIVEEFNVQDKFKDKDMTQMSFQLMPSVQFNNSVELVISCGESPYFQDPLIFMEQLRNPTFLNGDPVFVDSPEPDLADIGHRKEKISLFSEDEKLKERLRQKTNFVVEFTDFESIIELAQTLILKNTKTNLFEMKRKFYLHVFFDLYHIPKYVVTNSKSMLQEFGKESKATIEELKEHGRQLGTVDNALQELRQHFCEDE